MNPSLLERKTKLSPARQLLLAKRLRGENNEVSKLPQIASLPRPQRLPLSFAQQRLWLLAQMGASEAYHIFNGWRLKGQLDGEALQRALDRIVARHEALRTTFVVIEGQPMQRIAAAEESRFQLMDHDLAGAADAEASLKALVREEAASEFDLEAGPLIRGRLIRLGEAEHALLITMHHIVSDGWSMEVLMRELSALYGAFARGAEDPLPELSLQYADYAVWQRRWMEGELLRQQAEYWERRLSGAPTLLELPADHARPAEQEYAGGWVRIVLEENLTRKLKELSRRHGATLYMTLLAGWGALLARLSGQQEVVIGTPVANRGRVEIEGLIGFFVNRLALRLDVSGSPSLGELLARVKEEVLAAQQHQDIPFEQVVELARPARSLAHSPLFQVVFNWQQNAGGGGGLAMPGVELRPLGAASDVVAKHDLLLSLWEMGERIVGSLVYATSLFERATVERYLGYLRTLLEGMVADEHQAIDLLPLLPEGERQQVLYEWNATEAAYPHEQLVHELFAEQVAKTPDAVAVVYEEATLSYGELNRRANQLAHYLRALGVGPNERVALCLDRSLEMIVGLLGVLKAGGAYVPLDPAYPVERLRYMVEDSAPVAVLTQSQWQGCFSGFSEKLAVVNLDEGVALWQKQPQTTLEPARVTPEDLAYVIYTSGSTGLAKGVMVEHRQLVNYVASISEKVGVEERWTYGLVSTFAADLGHTVLYASLLRGGALHVLPEAECLDGERYERYCRERRLDCVKITPTHYQALLGEDGCAERIPERCLVFGGEALWPELVQRVKSLRPDCRIYNHYGPTECTVGALSEVVAERSGAAVIALGRPLGNMRVYVLDGNGAPAPVGVVGEIYIGGAGVARGYLQRAAVTAERFVSDPFAVGGSERMYQTGDLGRWKTDGSIEFVGRNDFQVKVRGYRIELGEIEASLREHAGVREAVVLARADESGEKRLVAYYTRAEENGGGGGEGIGAEELRQYLSAKLPEYMAPAAYVYLQKLPLTANGKLDRKALPEPETEAYGARAYEEPVGEIERAVAEIWADVLQVERVGRHDNFFELGGHSLLAVRVIARMRRAGLEVDVRALFAKSTLAELAAEIGSQTMLVEVPANGIQPGCEAITPEMLPLVQLTAEEIEKIVRGVPGGAANVQDIYPLAPLQEGILFHHLMEGESDPYILSSLYSFDSRQRLESYLEAMQAVIDRHDILRTGVVWEGLPEPVQVVWRKAVLPVEEVELEAEAGDGVAQLRKRYNPRSYRMDVRRAPMLRVAIARDEEQGRWLMMLLQHHLIGDHVTTEGMQEEIEACLLGQGDRLARPLPFRNLVAQARLGISREEHEAYFRELLGEVEEPTAPFGLLNVQGDGTGVTQAQMKVEAGLAGRIRERARKLRVSAASLCHVAWAQVAARTTGREDVVFGTVLFGRMQGGEGAEQAMGLFMNTLPVRMRVGEEGAEASVREAHRQLAGLMRHEHASLALAQRCSGVPAPAPLFTSLFNYRHSMRSGQARSAEKARAWEGIQGVYGYGSTNYPVVLSVDDLGEGFSLSTLAEVSIDARRVCQYMQRALESLVEALESEPSRPLRELEVIPETEKWQILYEWNATAGEYPRERCVHELFEEQVEKTPDAVAVVYEEATLSYGELNRRANQLAHYLRELGVGPDQRVALYMERSLEMVVGLLGVMKAGGAYVPLDPAYPVERLRYMLDDSAPVVLLTRDYLRQPLTGIEEAVPIVDLIEVEPRLTDRPETNPKRIGADSIEERLAYVIYTSGSTGTPKGVGIEHRNVVSFISWAQQAFTREDLEITLFSTSLNFDLAAYECLVPLTVGGRVRMVTDALELVSRPEEVTLINTVPSAMAELVKASDVPTTVRVVNLAGEPLKRWLVEEIFEKTEAERVCNLYGPSETTTYSTWVSMRREEGFAAHIGRPIANTRVHILNNSLEPAPVGVIGEIYIGGAGVARGYLNRADQTAERFLQDPYGEKAGARMYQTGDLGRWQAAGTLEFLGRVDQQVKIRGYRIELGEIEARLREHEAVQEAVVIEREDSSGDKRLVAYYSGAESNGAGKDGTGAEELRRHLSATLPEYMTPAAYVRLAKLPLTANGKLDRKALPEPERDAYWVREYEAPQGEAERALAEIWAEVLKLERVGRYDNFFELGGHSLLVVRVIARLRQVGLDVDVRTLFVTPVLAELAAAMEDMEVVL